MQLQLLMDMIKRAINIILLNLSSSYQQTSVTVQHQNFIKEEETDSSLNYNVLTLCHHIASD